MVVTRISDPFYARVVSAIEERAQGRGSLALIASATDDAVEAERVVGRLLQRRLDGLIAVLPEQADVSALARAIDRGTPVVFVDRPPLDLDCDQVVADNVSGTALAVRQLVDHGHRRIACFAHATGMLTAGERVRGFREGLDAAGIDADDRLVVVVPDDPDRCAQAWGAMRALDDPPTAIVTTNSRTTVAVLAALGAEAHHVAMVGFDDVSYAPLLDPPLTTVAQDPEAIGHEAADLLFDRIAGLTGARRRIMIGTRLIARGSGEIPAVSAGA